MPRTLSSPPSTTTPAPPSRRKGTRPYTSASASCCGRNRRRWPRRACRLNWRTRTSPLRPRLATPAGRSRAVWRRRRAWPRGQSLTGSPRASASPTCAGPRRLSPAGSRSPRAAPCATTRTARPARRRFS